MSRRWLVAVSVVAHLSIVVGLFISGVWRLERLEPPRAHATLLQPPPPPPPAPSGPVAVVTPIKPRPHRTIVRHAQPVVRPTEPVVPESDLPRIGDGSGSGKPTDVGPCTQDCAPDPTPPPPAPVCGNGKVETGEQCDDGNTLEGDGCSATCRIVVKPAAIPPSVLQGLRISGETQLHPSEVTQNQMVRDGVSRVEALVTLCVSTSGSVTSAAMRTSTRYEAYDQVLLTAIRAWRYRPYLRDGAPVPACSVVRFVYTINR